MGLFDVFKKKENTQQTASAEQQNCISRVNLAKTAVEKVCLEKKPLIGLKAQVGLVLDYSGSMDSLYRNGTIQHLVEQIIPLAMQFDDNAQMECWLFSSDCCRLDDVTLNNLPNYIRDNTKGHYMGGTSYAPVMNNVINVYNDYKTPSYVLFVTDGDCCDHERATDYIVKAAKLPIFWQFVGIGSNSSDFRFLQMLDDMDGRYVDNADFFTVKNINDITYKDLLDEFPHWLENEKVKAMLS